MPEDQTVPALDEVGGEDRLIHIDDRLHRPGPKRNAAGRRVDRAARSAAPAPLEDPKPGGGGIEDELEFTSRHRSRLIDPRRIDGLAEEIKKRPLFGSRSGNSPDEDKENRPSPVHAGSSRSSGVAGQTSRA